MVSFLLMLLLIRYPCCKFPAFPIFTGNISCLSHIPLHNESELLQAIATGDEASFRQLYNQFHLTVFQQAFHYLQSEELASDAVQDIFIKLWDKKEKLAEVKDVKAYIFIVARNIIISTLRKKVFHHRLDEELEMIEEDTHLPDRQLSYKESLQIIQEGINSLPQQQQKAYTLSRTQGLSHEEIAKEMRISTETVKTHIKQALKSLRAYLTSRSVDLGVLIIFLLRCREW